MIRGKTICALLSLALVFSGCVRELGLQPQYDAEVEKTSGDNVRLFYGGTQEAKDIFCSGETVTVYRA
jgi:hypothetical protein